MRVTGALVIWFCGSFSIAQDSSESEIVRQASERQRRLESIATFKLHAMVGVEAHNEAITSSHEVWLESRGDKIWARMRQIDQAADKQSQSREKVARLLGSDLAETLIFDGKRMIVHSPVKMEVTIEQAERFPVPDGLRTIFPRSWTNFSMTPYPGKSTFSRFFSERLNSSTTDFSASGDRLIIKHVIESTDPEKPVAVKLRRLEIGSDTGLIRESEASGGMASPIVSNLEWLESDGVWFASRGIVTIGGTRSRRAIKWEIHEFTADPRQVRTSFTLDESKLPLGTRIETEPQGRQEPRSIRYVGGQEGQREFALKEQAIRMVFER